MLSTLNSLLFVITIAIGTFMIERYVLLEPAMEPKKQRNFYILCFCLIVIAFIILKNRADYIILFLGGLNIYLARKEHRLRGFLLVMPLIGLINGIIAAPLSILQIITVKIFGGKYSKDSISQIDEFLVYIVVAVMLVIFCFKGKNWRRWFKENMKDRRPRKSEYIIICITGILVMFFTYRCRIIMYDISHEAPQMESKANTLICFYMLTAFVLTITLIVLIIQGNKRKFYHDKVSGMQFSIIATMADIVENRDENTGGHIKRTAKYVEIVGEKLRSEGMFPETLTEEYLSDMIVAAPLHDIGKIHIPDSILNKPARLTPEEFEIMKTHTTAGRDVLLKAQSQLGEFDYLNIAVEMAEYHHEWWNGKGYPNALAGEDIPLCARIMAIADVFDALTAKRCYKDAMPVEKAYSIIEEETGTHFDPVVAKAFLDSKDKVESALSGTK